MEVLVLEKFFHSVPKEMTDKVKQKMKDLVTELVDNKYDTKKLSGGWGYRSMKNTSRVIHKVRIDNFNRILFTFGGKFDKDIRDEYKRSVVFLAYCNHNSQSRTTISRDFSKQNVVPLTEEELREEDRQDVERVRPYILNNSIIAIADLDYLEDVFGEEGRYYYLNDRQNKIVQPKDKGEFILGSAGSGKTTIGVHKLINHLINIEDTQAIICYFTYSSILRDKTKKVFQDLARKIYGLDEAVIDRVDFFTIEEFLEQRSQQEVKVISFLKFKEWYEKREKQKFDVVSLWKERRGVLKGIIGIKWQNETNIPIDNFDMPTLMQLSKIKYIAFSSDGTTFTLLQNIFTVCQFVDIVKDLNGAEFRRNLYYEYNQQISSKIELTKDEYIYMKENYSSFEVEERYEVYDVFEKFNDYLKMYRNIGYIEEGDLVREVLKEIKPEYDYMVIDEIQDMTEIQVYFLSQLLKKKKNILVSGDYHQTVHPTFFKDGRVKSIFYFLDSGVRFETERLYENYRSSKDIVDLANIVTTFRNEKIPGKDEDKFPEIAKRESTQLPYLYMGRKETLWDSVKDKSYVSIIVANESVKEKLNRQHPELKARVFTVSEMKGIERKYIITYNIISEYKKEWESIVSTTKIHSESYRYYFNLLYVAITRARDVLGMVEDDLPVGISEGILRDVEVIERFDVDKLSLQQLSTVGEAMKVAMDNELNKAFEQAISEFEGIMENNDATSLDKEMAKIGKERCMIKQEYEKTRDKEICSASLMKLGEYDEAIKYLRNTNNVESLFTSIILAKNSYSLHQELEKFEANPITLLVQLNNPELTERYLLSEYNEINQYKGQVGVLIQKINKFPRIVKN